MTIILRNKLNQFKQWSTTKLSKHRLIKTAEVFFFLLPTLFLLYHYLMAVLSSRDFFQLLVSNPKYTIQFITYASYYFVSLQLRFLEKIIDDTQENSIVKLVLLAILISQLLSLNLIAIAIVLIISRQLFHGKLFQLNFSEVTSSKKKWLLIPCFFLILISGTLQLMTMALS